MTRKRLGKADRRASILEAATKVFAEYGRTGAKTQQIATEAQVSEALIFRHFPSKDALYCAVLRKLVRDQDTNIQAIGHITPDSEGIVRMLWAYLGACVSGNGQPSPENIRVLYASLAGDGQYARITYRRACRISAPPLQAALESARAAGDLVGEGLDAINIVAFMEHVGSNIAVGRMGATPTIQYSGDEDAIVRQAVLFCGRGIGLREEVILARIAALQAEQETLAAQAAVRARKETTPRKAAPRGAGPRDQGEGRLDGIEAGEPATDASRGGKKPERAPRRSQAGATTKPLISKVDDVAVSDAVTPEVPVRVRVKAKARTSQSSIVRSGQ